MKDDLAIFEGYQIRRHYDEQTETWWFSVVDIIRVLTQQADYKTARKYWNKLKERLGREGSQLVTDCHQLKMPAADGKSYLTDAAARQAEEEVRTLSGLRCLGDDACYQTKAALSRTRGARAVHGASTGENERSSWKTGGGGLVDGEAA